MTGIVERFEDRLGYGFIKTESGKTAFVHWSYILDPKARKGLNKGDVVEFKLYETKKGWEALDVRKV